MRRSGQFVVSRLAWSRTLHLVLGGCFAVLCAMVWPGLTDASPRTLGGLFVAPLPLVVVLSCVPALRRTEGLLARALLVPGDDEITVEHARSWADRGRLLLWLVVRVELGVLASQLIALGVAAVAASSGLVAGDRLPDPPVWAAVPFAVAVVLALLYALAGVGWLAAAAARRLLHPSAAERLAVQQARTERLLERARLASELHDSMGHALTVTLLQAGAAREAAGRDPAFVDRALAAVEDSARRAMDDLERVLALLREASDAPDPPTLVDLDRLVRSAEAAGAPVDLQLSGSVSEVPTAVSRAGYRILQEGLTNALRHAGPVPIGLGVQVGADTLRLVVRNAVPVPAAAATGTGSGLRGLRARAALLGGTARVGPTGEEWRVEVDLPLTAP